MIRLRVVGVCLCVAAFSISCQRVRGVEVTDAVIYYTSFDTVSYFPITEESVLERWEYRLRIRRCAEHCSHLMEMLKGASSSVGKYDGAFARFVMRSKALGDYVLDNRGNVKGDGVVDLVQFSRALDELMASKEVRLDIRDEHLLTPAERLRSRLRPPVPSRRSLRQ